MAAATFSWLDRSLPLQERVDLLVAAMTTEEKCAQLLHDAPAIERLGIPAFDWWNECLHGVARAGRATVFPQALGMAASFDPELLLRVAVAISDEVRAKHHEALLRGNRGRYFGLTCWSPNINILRDPRWGRGQETYGEDPHLSARMGVAFVRGLQGDHPDHLKVVATPKHFAVHSGPEADRHRFDACVSRRDLAETYLPAFRACVEEGAAASVMAAYNRVNGEPACASPTLLTETLRRDWGFPGYVVSDCWAVSDFHEYHQVTSDAAESAALAVREGCDLECGCSYRALPEALERGLVVEDEIDACVRRLFTARFRLGMFDPPEQVCFASIPPEAVRCEEHIELARRMARESIVLLENDGLLPLAPGLGRILVVGPNARSDDALLGNYHGTAPQMATPLDGILEWLGPGAAVDYLAGCHLHRDEPIDEEAIGLCLDAAPDVIVAVVGLTAHLEGEEGSAAGSDQSGDRAGLGLPGRQVQLIERLLESGTPVVLVVLAGGPVDLGWVRDRAAAIVFAWYPGEQGGHALADILFGDVSPAGRLPVTFPRSLEQLPPFDDYAMRGRTYRFSEEEPSYRFGYGLSYTDFAYDGLALSRSRIAPDESVAVSVNVKNVGAVAGDEVVQLYVTDVVASVPVPRLHLEGVRRIHLAPGEERTVTFTLGPSQLAAYDDEGRAFVEPGAFVISVGGGQPSDPRAVTVRAVLEVVGASART